MVDRILAEFAESEISALPLEPRLLLTELGEAAVEQYETAAQKKRIEQALHLADLIHPRLSPLPPQRYGQPKPLSQGPTFSPKQSSVTLRTSGAPTRALLQPS